jgi:hypothetical protein
MSRRRTSTPRGSRLLALFAFVIMAVMIGGITSATPWKDDGLGGFVVVIVGCLFLLSGGGRSHRSRSRRRVR